MPAAPVVIAFLVADKVFREAETGKVHVAGTYNRIVSPSFPMVFSPLFIYLAMTDLREGRHDIGLEIRHLESGKLVLKVSQPIQSPGPLEVIEAIFCFGRLLLQEEGLLEMSVSCNGSLAASRSLHVKQIQLAAPPPEHGLS